MKKLFIIFMFTCTVVFAGESIPFKLTNISTTTTGTATSTNVFTDGEVSGSVEGLFINFTGDANPTADVDVVTSSAGEFGVAQTIFSIDSITADGYYPIRIPTVSTAGSANVSNVVAKIQLSKDTVRLVANDCNKTNVNLKVFLILSK